jgi:hypothetical protein
MERIFWVTCPHCFRKFYADLKLRHSEVALICPFCHQSFLVRESPEVDDRVSAD